MRQPWDMTPFAEGLGDTIGPYSLLATIGEGGMGVVYMAEQSQPVRRKVALKVIKPGMDSRQVITRFEAERQALALMDHANIARIFDGGVTESGRPYFVMELVNGQPITDFCNGNRLTLRQRLELFVPVCQAVQHAHQKGIIHRDLKPSNVLVSMHDATPVVKVIDFGVAKALGQELTDQTLFTGFAQMVGTPLYMSPEQAGRSAIDTDTRSDIYTLGVLLYELLTGTTPFDKERFRRVAYDEIRRIVREEEPPRPSTRLSESGEARSSISAQRQMEPAKLTRLIRDDLDRIVMKALEKDRNRRYETANGLAADVLRYLNNEPVLAGAPSAGYRLRKVREERNKRSMIAGSLLFLAILGGVAGTLWGLMRAERANAQADINRRIARIKEETAAQLTDYLVRTFQSADPVGLEAAGFHGPGERDEDQMARRMLDRGAEIVHEYLRDQPLVRARLLDAMGNSYRNLGAWDAAQAQLEEGYDLRRSHLGDGDPDTVVSLQSLAHLARDSGDYIKADELYRDVIARRETLYKSDSLPVAETKAYLAWMTFYRPLSSEGPQFNQARLTEAERLLIEVLKVREAHLSKNHRDIGYTLAALASIKLGQPRQELSAIGYVTRAAEVFRQSDQDTFFGNAMLELVKAEQHRKAGRYTEAEAGYLNVMGVFRRNLGHRHPLIVLQLGNLAGMYRRQGDLVKAQKTATEFLELIRPMPALRSQSIVVDGLMQYADEVRQRRSVTEAGDLYREALQYARERPQGNEKNVESLKKRLTEMETTSVPKQ